MKKLKFHFLYFLRVPFLFILNKNSSLFETIINNNIEMEHFDLFKSEDIDLYSFLFHF